MTLLTLDLSTQLGWTLGPPSQRYFEFGTFKLPKTGEEIGPFALAYDDFLHNLIDIGQVTMVVFEAPILPRETQLQTIRKLYGLTWHTEYVCQRQKINCFEAHLQSVKLYMTGNGRATKEEMLRMVKMHGYDAKTFDEADAIAVRLYTIQQRFPECSQVLNLDLGLLGCVNK